MNTTLERLEGTRVKLTVTCDATEVAGYVADAYKTIARQAKIPGFRPGKAPRGIIDAHFGAESVLAQALEDLVERTYPKAIDEHRLRPVERPDMGELDLVEDGAEFTYTAEFDTRPELSLSSVEPVTVSVPSAKTTDEEIDAQVDYMRDRSASLEVVEGRGVQDSDFVLLSFAGTVDGKPADDLVVDRYLYEVGRGIMPQEFDQQITGAKVGETVHVEFVVPDTSSNPEYAGKPSAFEVEIHEIKVKTLPEADDAFAASIGYESAEEMRTEIRTRLDGNKAAGHIRLLEREARMALTSRLEGDVPRSMIDERVAEMTEEFYGSIKERGMSVEDYEAATGVTQEEITRDIAQEAVLRVREEFALEALFRQAELSYTDEELDVEVARLANSEKVSVESMRARLVDSGIMSMIRERLTHRVATRWLLDNAVVTDADASGADEGKKQPAKKAASAKKTAKKADADADAEPAEGDAPEQPAAAADTASEE